ncbi:MULTISPECIES: Eco57I restriction-modification methylase domain-containing protein [Psychrobacter]|uniref:Eco57I restriction-modification methylase domain-containing protein n=1 Tax=Psychrobacter TaxID=497 RepID=UPI0008A6D79F|nr:N-6 DNA methylase [Psychrobacter sp. AntiMn-1]AOY43711.1 type II restriction enzyme methylase subunit [Psychrobacter sp. AntiMn-1]
MSLFQSIVIEKYVRELDSTQLEVAWKRYANCFLDITKQDNIRLSKEEQYQEGFLRDLFVDIFGYTLNPNPNYNLTTEFKNKTSSKKADGAILKDGYAIGVIELKGMNTTDMSKIEAQAFGYKNNQPKCRYVITSNFQKLRLYIDNAVEYEEFDLFTMSQDRFALLYLLLRQTSMLADLPAKIKSESLSQEEAITKQLYKDYSVFKRELFADLTANNPDIDALILFQKSQKLLDRLLFIFFAEDSHLLPANFAKGIIDDWQQLKKLKKNDPLYDQIKQYFTFLDTGYKDDYSEIFAYNGGLFRTDSLLDSVIISDEILRSHILTLSEYDFDSEVDVNILGHIFENSLSELDEVKAQLAGEAVDKSQTKRKKDGVFYTPKYITKYIVENTVGKLCEDKKSELAINDEDYQQDVTINKDGTKKKKSAKQLAIETQALERLHAYRDWLLEITICDPACGSGAFLNEALNFLIAEHEYIVELETKLFGSGLAYPDIENSILENNLFGVDINEESVEIAKLSLWLRTAQPRRKLNNLNDNIQCGNSLIDDPAVAGDKAFNWQTAFPKVFAKGGFDVVIGNPPYLRIQGLQSAYPEMVSYYEKQFESAMGNYDIYVLFIERSLDLIKKTGQVSLILPHKFLISEFGEGVRKLLAENKLVASLLHFEEHLVFEVTTYTCILTLDKKPKTDLQFNFMNPQKIQEPFEWTSLSYDELTHDKWNLLSNTEIKLFEKLHKQPLTAKDVFSKIFVGLQTSADKIYLIDGCIEGDVVKGYSKSLGCEVEIETGLMKPMLKGQDVSRYNSLINENFVLFPYSIDSDGKAKPMTENEIAQNFPLGYKYLKANEAELRGREKGRFNEPNQWYLFGRKQGINEVEQSKIITPEISLGCNMSFDVGSMYHNTKCYSFILDKPSDLAYKFYLSVLNSKILWFFLSNTGYVLRGGYFTFKTNYLYPFPLPKLPNNAKDFVEKVDLMLSLNEQLQDSTGKFIRTLQRKFDIDKLSKKLESWHELTYADFIKELGKKKIKMSLSDEAEWEEYFLAEQTKAKQLMADIKRTDREIDQMVYKLYDLTDDEIAIIEAS